MERIKNDLLDWIRENGEANLKTIQKETGISYPTVLKYVDIMIATGEVDVKFFGQSKVVFIPKCRQCDAEYPEVRLEGGGKICQECKHKVI